MVSEKDKHQINVDKLNLRVRTILRQKGMTMKMLAKSIGMQPDSLSRSLTQNPTYKTLHSIAEGIGCHLTDLIPSSEQSKELKGLITYRDQHYFINSIYDLIELTDRLKEEVNK